MNPQLPPKVIPGAPVPAAVQDLMRRLHASENGAQKLEEIRVLNQTLVELREDDRVLKGKGAPERDSLRVSVYGNIKTLITAVHVVHAPDTRQPIAAGEGDTVVTGRQEPQAGGVMEDFPTDQPASGPATGPK